MGLHTVLAFSGGILLTLFSFWVLFRNDTNNIPWVLPALLSLSFFLFSLYTSISEGPLGFWADHTRSFWGNQIWFDLLQLCGIAWFFVVPRAKAKGVRLVPWLVLIICTGSIGFLALTARVLYLESKS